MNDQSLDSYVVAWHMAGMIILALLVVFLFKQLGFRFVVSAGVGGS